MLIAVAPAQAQESGPDYESWHQRFGLCARIPFTQAAVYVNGTVMRLFYPHLS